MSKISVLPPSGFRDFTPGESATRLDLIETITHVYRAHGFQPIAMPFLENLSTLEGKGGGIGNEKLIFKVLKRGEELAGAIASGSGSASLADMGLRFDLTLPLARYYARYRNELPKPFKVFQIGPVWRADRPQKGRFREFFQCDVDMLGARDIGAEIDCLTAVVKVFDRVGLENVEVHVNDRRLLAAFKPSEMTEAQWAEALITLDKLDKIGREGVEKEWMTKLGSVPRSLSLALDGAGLDEFRSFHSEAADSVGEIVRLLGEVAPRSRAVFNPSLVRGQDYYTGTIFELRHASLSGSLGGGGRYNRLLEVFGGEETPAFGGSIGFERLYMLLQERDAGVGMGAGVGAGGVGMAGRAGVSLSDPQIFFPLFDASMRGPVLGLVRLLRDRGLRVDVSPDAVKLKTQFKYADDRRIPFTAILGSDEWASRRIKIKSMALRTETELSLDPPSEFAARVEEMIRAASVVG